MRQRRYVLKAARQARALHDVWRGAPAVVAARLSPAAAGRRGALATGLEFTRMAPEKALAFAAGGAAWAEGWARLGRAGLEHGLAELEAAHRLMLQAARQPLPPGPALAWLAWWQGAALRGARLAETCAGAGLAASGAALRPVQRTLAGNRRRLG
ncbi:hypothetical protein [Pseudoroseomonas cervicalis]|uniref:hypothetical protein n=1 Tax=Teichococcus cervicalis TaxID=204525 RepID=UPI0022F1DA09|nr:hypothetical protein [Pseudoroseomonas cervicalis]WBV43863.1 hypothetical protein PFY06_04665 [Pseudoroseomonas cervicalis]